MLRDHGIEQHLVVNSGDPFVRRMVIGEALGQPPVAAEVLLAYLGCPAGTAAACTRPLLRTMVEAVDADEFDVWADS